MYQVAHDLGNVHLLYRASFFILKYKLGVEVQFYSFIQPKSDRRDFDKSGEVFSARFVLEFW